MMISLSREKSGNSDGMAHPKIFWHGEDNSAGDSGMNSEREDRRREEKTTSKN